MSELRQELEAGVERLFAAHAGAAAAAQAQGWQAALWRAVEELGIPALLVPEARQGIGADWEDACAVLQAAGRWQVPLPVAETILARRLAAAADLPLPDGPASIATAVDGALSGSAAGWRFSGQLRGVPWGRDVAHVVIALPGEPGHAVVLRTADAQRREAVNLAGEPRDDLRFTGATVLAAPAAGGEALQLHDHAALARTAQISGALHAALQRSVAHACERQQFGRPIGQFQAVQQQLAVFGTEAAAVACAVRAAAIAAGRGPAALQIAAAKLRANLAIGVGTACAHQVHAAIGFTREHALHHATQRLWSWRSDYGNDRYWSLRLGDAALAGGADRFWADLTARDDAAGRPRDTTQPPG